LPDHRLALVEGQMRPADVHIDDDAVDRRIEHPPYAPHRRLPDATVAQIAIERGGVPGHRAILASGGRCGRAAVGHWRPPLVTMTAQAVTLDFSGARESGSLPLEPPPKG